MIQIEKKRKMKFHSDFISFSKLIFIIKIAKGEELYIKTTRFISAHEKNYLLKKNKENTIKKVHLKMHFVVFFLFLSHSLFFISFSVLFLSRFSVDTTTRTIQRTMRWIFSAVLLRKFRNTILKFSPFHEYNERPSTTDDRWERTRCERKKN